MWIRLTDLLYGPFCIGSASNCVPIHGLGKIKTKKENTFYQFFCSLAWKVAQPVTQWEGAFLPQHTVINCNKSTQNANRIVLLAMVEIVKHYF